MCLKGVKGINKETLYTHTHVILNIKLCLGTTDPLYDYSGLNCICHSTPSLSFSDLIRESIPTLSSLCLTRRSIESNPYGFPIKWGMTKGNYCLNK